MSYFWNVMNLTVEIKTLDLFLTFGFIFAVGMWYSFSVHEEIKALYDFIHKLKMNISHKFCEITHLKK